jgi:hypothetical protein
VVVAEPEPVVVAEPEPVVVAEPEPVVVAEPDPFAAPLSLFTQPAAPEPAVEPVSASQPAAAAAVTTAATLPATPAVAASTPAAPAPAAPVAAVPVAPVQVPAPTPPWAVVGAPAPRSRRGLLIGVGIGVVLLLALGASLYVVYNRLLGDPVRNAVAGNCIADLPAVPEGEELEVKTGRIVDCTDPAADYVVEGRLDRISDEQADSAEVCQSYEAATFVYRGTGYVLCLSALD